MTTMLIVAAANPSAETLSAALEQLALLDVVVDVGLARNRSADVHGRCVRDVAVMHPQRRPSVALPRTLLTPSWYRALARSVVARFPTARDDLALRCWYRARWDPWVATAAAGADVLVALDRYAVYTVWRLRRRHRGAIAVYGLDAAVLAVRSRAAGPRTGPVGRP